MAGKISNLVVSTEKVDEILNELPASNWQLFRMVINKKFLKMLTINLIGLIGAFFGIYIYLYLTTGISLLGSESPFSTNLGIGYPFAVGTEAAVALGVLDLKYTFFTLLVPALMIFGLFLSGIFYVIKRWVYLEENISIQKTFFIGIRKNATNFLFITFLLGGVIWLVNLAITAIKTAQITNGNNFFLVFAMVLIYIVLALYIIMSLFMMSLAVTYKMNIIQLIRNSFFLTFGLIIRNIIYVIISFLPAVFFVIPGLEMVSAMFYALYGISFSIIVFSIYSQGVFERIMVNKKMEVAFETANDAVKPEETFKYDKSENKTSEIENNDNTRTNEPKKAYAKNKKRKNTFSNPKKKK